MVKKTKWAYQDLSLRSLPGEKWESVPGFEGEYEVSSHGRIKSLSRWRAVGNGGYTTTERIRKQGIKVSRNHTKGDSTYCLSIGLKSSGLNVSTSTARYVYYAFVAAFDLDNPNLVIICKNGDGRNTDYSNLMLTDRSGKMIRAFRRKRTRTHFEAQKVPVDQLTLDGKCIASYQSITAASKKTGFHLTAIAGCVDGKIFQAYGYRWESPQKPSKTPAKAARPDFNHYLWQKLGSPAMSKKNPIAALNLSDQDMPGERWVIIEGTGDAYLISNYGRIKSQPRLKHGKFHVWSKGMVKKLIPDGNARRPPSCLLCQLAHEGKKYEQSVARLVYHHFVQRINLQDRTNRIGYKNGKFYDLNYRNLKISGL